ncbi:MAG TPA: hypothetical protein VIA18_08390 [Polyangia bacterium]|jgi:hypothetical protein|nr:hypothetical protein [Polyangia bacterium]
MLKKMIVALSIGFAGLVSVAGVAQADEVIVRPHHRHHVVIVHPRYHHYHHRHHGVVVVP